MEPATASPLPAPGRLLGVLPLAPATVTILAVAGALAAGRPAAAGVLACFGAGLTVSALDAGFAAPYLVAVAPLGFWHPEIHGVQAPALEAAAAACALGCLPVLIRRRARPSPADLAMAAVATTILVSGLGPTSTAAWAHRFLLWGSLAVVFPAARVSLRRLVLRRLFLVAVGAAALAEAIVALVQYVQGSSGRFSRLGGAIVYPQPKGTLEHPNALAPYLAISMLLVAGLALAERGSRRLLAALTAVVIALGALVPFSRGGWISLAAGFLVWGAAQRRPRRLVASAAILVAVLAAGIAGGGAFGARLSSIVSRRFSDLYGFRWELAQRAGHVIAHHPLTGTGVFNETGTYAGRPTLATHPHDLVLGLAVFFGIPAALAFVALAVLAIRSSWRAVASRLPGLSAEGAGGLAAIAALAVDGLFEYPYWNLALTVQTVTLLAYAVALGEAAAIDPG